MKIDYDHDSIRDELELLSLLIRDKPPGRFEAMEIVEGYEASFDINVNFGMRLAEYVRTGKLKDIKFLHMDMSSRVRTH